MRYGDRVYVVTVLSRYVASVVEGTVLAFDDVFVSWHDENGLVTTSDRATVFATKEGAEAYKRTVTS